MFCAMTPPGSTDSRWRSGKYHQGMPFIAPTTLALSPRARPISGATAGIACAFRVMKTTSASAIALMSSVHRGRTTNSSVRLRTRRPRDLLAPCGVRGAKRDRLGHGRMLQQHVVHLAWRDLFAAAVDHLLQAADQREIAVGVEESLVAGTEPTVDERFGIGLGIVGVRVEHSRALDDDLSALT